jgi:hypothetical protein
VADNALLLQASASLVELVTGAERWERFVWTVTAHTRLHAHPARVDPEAWQSTPIGRAWWRTERQSFVPVASAAEGRPGRQAVFLIQVQLQTLAQALDTPARCRRLHDAVATMSPAVLAYRDLAGVRAPLLDWLQARAAALDAGSP